MGKFLWFKSLAVVVLVMIAAASAHADTRIWVQAGKPSGFSSFEAAMQERGWMRGGAIASEGLATVACYHAAQTGVNKTPECAKQFLDRNNVQGEVVSIGDFFARSNGEGWWIPHDPSVASAQAAAEQPVRAVVAPAAAAQSGAEIAALKAQLQRLQNSVVQIARGNEQGELLAERVAGLQETVQGVVTQFTALNETLGSVPGMQEALRTLETGLNSLKDGVMTSAMVDTINRQIGVAQQQLEDKLQASIQAALETEMKTLKIDGALGHGLLAKVSPEAAEQYAEHSSAIHAAVIALAFGLGLILFSVLNGRQKKVSATVKKHNQLLVGKGGVLSRLEGVEKSLHEVRMEACALQAAVVDTVTLADETHQVVMATQKDVVRFNDDNPGLEVLHSLALGQENGVEWKGSYCGKRFSVKIWRDDATPMGQVQTNVVRSVETGQLAESLALKRLKQRLEAAIIGGRVPLMDAVKKVA